MADPEQPETLKPLIDGGTAGLQGQIKVSIPTVTSCYECTLYMLDPGKGFPLCTIANTPRLPEHCVEWAMVLEWPRVFVDRGVDRDNIDDVGWIHEQATKRAQQYGIPAFTIQFTQGVMKQIIPVVASTNAVIAAMCTQEALKIVTGIAPYLDNYCQYNGSWGVYTSVQSTEKDPECTVCGALPKRELHIKGTDTVQDILDWLDEKSGLMLKKASLRWIKRNGASKSVYMRAPKMLEEMTRVNLKKEVQEVFSEEITDDQAVLVTVTDPALGSKHLELHMFIQKE